MEITSEIDALMVAANQTLALIGDAEERRRILLEERILLEADIHGNKAVAMEIAFRLREVATRAGHLNEEEGSIAVNDGLEALRDLIAKRLYRLQPDAAPQNVTNLVEHFQKASGADREPAEDTPEGETLCDAIRNALAGLTPREAKTLRMLYGIDPDTAPQKPAAVARHFNVTSVRVQAIRDKALRKLRHPSRSDRLRVYLGQFDFDSAFSPEGRLLMAIFK